MGRRADNALEAAKMVAAETRAHFKDQFAATKLRLRPARLKEDAAEITDHYVQEAKDVAVTTVKDHPVAFGASFLGVLAFWYRRPLIEKSPDAIDGVGDGLARLRDWIAPADWSAASGSDEED